MMGGNSGDSTCKVADFSWPEFENVELPTPVEAWGTVTSKNVVVYGICSNCTRK